MRESCLLPVDPRQPEGQGLRYHWLLSLLEVWVRVRVRVLRGTMTSLPRFSFPPWRVRDVEREAEISVQYPQKDDRDAVTNRACEIYLKEGQSTPILVSIVVPPAGSEQADRQTDTNPPPRIGTEPAGAHVHLSPASSDSQSASWEVG